MNSLMSLNSLNETIETLLVGSLNSLSPHVCGRDETETETPENRPAEPADPMPKSSGAPRLTSWLPPGREVRCCETARLARPTRASNLASNLFSAPHELRRLWGPIQPSKRSPARRRLYWGAGGTLARPWSPILFS